jgi:hypothetical protein
MSGISPLSGKDAWARYLQTRGLSAQTAAKIADTLSQENTGERVDNGEVVEEGGVPVDLTDGLSQEETTALGLKAERTVDRYIRQNWAKDGEDGVETEEQGANVTETDELERAYASMARYADAHGITYEQAQRIYFESTSFSRLDLRGRREERLATRSAWVTEYSTWKATHSDGIFTDWIKEKFGITAADDAVLGNLRAYLGDHAQATDEQLVDYLLLNGFAARLPAAIQTDPAEGDNPGLGLHEPITGRTPPEDYKVAALERFYKNAPAAEEPAGEEGETRQAAASDPPTQSVQTADEAFYNIELARQMAENADQLLTGENPNLARVLELYREAQSQIENLSSDPEAAELYAQISGKIGDLVGSESDDYSFSTETGEDGQEIWTFGETPPPPAETTASASPTETPVAEAPTGAMIYSGQVPSGILDSGNSITAEQLVLIYSLTVDEISAQSREGETALQTLARLYPGVSGWTAVLTETDNSIQGYLPADRAGMQIVTIVSELNAGTTSSEPVAEEANPGFRTEIGEDGQEVWTFGDTPAVQVASETAVEPQAVINPEPTAPPIEPEPPVVAFAPEGIIDIDDGSDIPFAALSRPEQNVEPPVVAAAEPQAPAAPVEPPVVTFAPERIIDFDNGRDIPFAEIVARQEPSPVVSAPPPPDTQIQELRSQANQAVEDLRAFANENGLTDSDMHGNLRWAETQLARVVSTDDAQEIQKFIDAIPGLRSLGETLVAQRQTQAQAGTTAAAGTETAPASTRGRLGDLPTDRTSRESRARWGAVLGSFQSIVDDVSHRMLLSVTVTGYLCFNPSTGEIDFGEIETDPYLYGSDQDGFLRGLSNARQNQRFTGSPNFPTDVYEAVPGREGWYRIPLSLTGQP